MIFNSLEYAAFLPAVVALYWLVGHRARLALLLGASYVFYGWWDARFLGLIALSTVIDHTVSRAIATTGDERMRKGLLVVSAAANLGILGFFKYYGFFVDSAEDVLSRLGLGVTSPTLEIVLPVGISFYTFQTLSYTFDVYRRRIDPENDILTFAVYVAFFPQLVAGPIERAHRLLPQFQQRRPRPTGDDVAGALFLVGQGLVKKVVIADGMAPVVDAAFADPAGAGWVTLTIGVYAFAIQIYGDFSGYTDIARGSARLLGIELTPNFRQPYLSGSVTAFWRTWHMSLSTWLRDYLYVPLGGNRRGRLTTYRNLMVTMLLGGLWHGAAWTFVAWGGLHGLFLVIDRLRGRGDGRDLGLPRGLTILAVIGTFHLVAFAWIFFRATSFADAFDVVGGIVSLRPGQIAVDGILTLLVLGGASLAIDLAQRTRDDDLALHRLPAVAQGAVYAVGLAALVVWSGGTPVPFIYFQF